jgi:hypothetical protein
MEDVPGELQELPPQSRRSVHSHCCAQRTRNIRGDGNCFFRLLIILLMPRRSPTIYKIKFILPREATQDCTYTRLILELFNKFI